VLERVLRRGVPGLRFEEREALLVPQTEAVAALYAAVHVVAGGRRAVTIDAVRLLWLTPSSETLATLPLTKAVAGGRYVYPPGLPLEVGPPPAGATLVFSEDLLRLPAPPPAESALDLELRLGSSPKGAVRRLWRVQVASWPAPAALRWLGG
jgi:hypothetical protein